MVRRRLLGVLLSAVMICSVTSCNMISDSTNIVEELDSKGYEVEQVDDNTFYVSGDGVDYYYDCWFNKPFFRKAVLVMETGRESGYEMEISISKEKNNRMSVLCVRPCTETFANGNVSHFNEMMKFEFKDDFTDGNLTNDRGFHDMHSDYRGFNELYLTPEELQEIYNRGLELEKEF